jgi:hypothetical protein
MLFAMLLSMISLVIVVVSLLRTNKKLKNLVKSVKLFAITSLVDRNMKKKDQYENFDSLFQDEINTKSRIKSSTEPGA